jgi:cyclic pyranopterin phosphate synthase
MDVGNSNGWDLKQVVSKREIVERIHAEMPLESRQSNYFGEVASRYYYQGTNEEIGIISSVTESFCSTCTRSRLSANGQLYTCLFATKGRDLQSLIRLEIRDEEIREQIQEVWGLDLIYTLMNDFTQRKFLTIRKSRCTALEVKTGRREESIAHDR